MSEQRQCHDETLCHSVGEVRAEKIKAIRELFKLYNILEDEEKKEDRIKRRKSDRTKGQTSLIDLPEYWYRSTLPAKVLEIPLIVSLPCLTMKLTSDKEALKDERCNLKLTLVEADNPHAEAPWKSKRKSVELRGGRTFVGCECVKFNGLQDQCPRSECGGSPECLTKPYPHCPPSTMYPGPKKYIQPTTIGSQTDPPCCSCVVNADNNAEYKAEDCNCKCHIKNKEG